VGDDPLRRDPWGLVSGSEGAITGTVVCAAVIAYGVGHFDSTAQLSLAIVATVGVYWLAHLHAVTISSSLTHGHHPVQALRHALVETAPVAAASILVVEETIKFFLRRRQSDTAASLSAPVAAAPAVA